MVLLKNRSPGRSQSERYLRAARSLRRRSLRLERLEPRVLLAGADPHDSVWPRSLSGGRVL